MLRIGLVIGLTASIWCGRALAAHKGFELSGSVGFSHLTLDGASGPFDDRAGIRLEPRVAFTPWQNNLPQLKIGFGLGVSGYVEDVDEDDERTIEIDGDVTFLDEDLVESLSFLAPEFQLSWRQTFGDEGRWFVEPGFGVGGVIGNYIVADDRWWSDEEETEWDATWGVRPFVRGGYLWDRFFAGIEVSYLWGGEIDLSSEAEGDVREFFIGGFFGGRW